VNGTLTTPTQRYFEAVRAHLADVPQQERDDLLEDLEQHLDEVAAEGEGSLEDRLGPPADYAAELRATAGLEGHRRPFVEVVFSTFLGRVAALPQHKRVQRLPLFLRELRPGWWVLRGYLLVVGWQLVFDSRNYESVPIPRPLYSPQLGLLAVALAAFASVWLGRRRHVVGRVVSVALTLTAVVAGQMAFARINQSMSAVQGVNLQGRYMLCHGEACDEAVGHMEDAGERDILGRDGRPITNIYAYGRDGAPLHDVRLFDQRGNPITIDRKANDYGRPIVTAYPVDLLGNPVTNAFPQKQAWQTHGSTKTIPPPTLDVRPLGDQAPARRDGKTGTRDPAPRERDRRH
jgi:hypothetical protein